MAQQIINIGLSPNDGTGDTLRAGGDKINDNFTELYNYANNLFGITNVPIDWQSPMTVEEQISNYFNNYSFVVPFTVTPMTIWWVKTSRLVNGGVEDSFYWFAKGKGSYGSGWEQTEPYDFVFLFKRVNSLEINTVIDLGEIGTTEIQDAVNTTGPYDLDEGTIYIFEATRSGVTYQYYYIGQQGITVGTGGNQTSSEDYIYLGGEVEPPNLDDYVTYEALESTFYDQTDYSLTDTLPNASFPLNSKFYFIVADDEAEEENLYFASREDNVESFVGSRIFLTNTNKHYDLGEPDYVQDGYNIWFLEESDNNNGNQGYFQFWLRKTRPIHTIDSNQFTFNKGVTSGAQNTGAGIEINDLALNGVFYVASQDRWFKGDLKCIDNTGDLTTGIETKWQPIGAPTPLN